MIQIISVIGAGTMGHCIAELFAIYGYQVRLYDVSEEVLLGIKDVMKEEILFLQRNGLYEDVVVEDVLKKIELFHDLEQSVKDADYVIEATFEDLELKQTLFQSLDGYCKDTAILASNTSTLPLDQMMKLVSEKRKERMMVCHWYNPAHIVPIAELSYFGNMPDEIYREVKNLYEAIGKQVVTVKKDVPGLVANRIQQVIAREVFSLIEHGVADAEDVERALTFGPAFRYATSGQLTIADFGGLDIWSVSLDNLLPHLENRLDANPIIKEKCQEGKLGFKTGEGFFKYPKDLREQIKQDYFRRLISQSIVCKTYKR